MAEESFIQKYTKSESLRRGIEVILKSDNYTDEYKALILKYLGTSYSAPTDINTTADEQLELLDKGGLILEEGKTGLVRITDKKPAVRGRIEKPTYIESELIKAIDIVVDELISPPPKQKPLTVPLSTYNDLLGQFSGSVAELEDYKELYLTTLSDLDLANLTIATLNQSLDACEIQKAVAENQSDTINSRYISLLGDFQSAIQKSIQEAIERVSLSAQVRGLQAQKEVLKQQLDIFRSQLVGAAAEANATAAGFFPAVDSQFFYKPISKQNRQGYDLSSTSYTRDDAGKADPAPGEIEIRNLNDKILSIVKLEMVSDSATDAFNKLGPWSWAPAGYDIPTRGVRWDDPKAAPTTELDVNIIAGTNQKFTLYANTFIAGRNASPIRPNGDGGSASNYFGELTIISTFSDGSTSTSQVVLWHIYKQKS